MVSAEGQPVINSDADLFFIGWIDIAEAMGLQRKFWLQRQAAKQCGHFFGGLVCALRMAEEVFQFSRRKGAAAFQAKPVYFLFQFQKNLALSPCDWCIGADPHFLAERRPVQAKTHQIEIFSIQIDGIDRAFKKVIRF